MIAIKAFSEAGKAYALLRRNAGLPALGRQKLTLKHEASGPVRFKMPDGAVYTAFLDGAPAPAAPRKR